MDEWTSKCAGIVDSHVHMGGIGEEPSMESARRAAGIERMNLVSIQNPETGAGLPQSLYMKSRYPGTYYVFAGLDHAGKRFGSPFRTLPLAEQVDAIRAMGCDGIKMIEGKPTSRRRMDIPVTDPYYADYWAHAEERGIPIVWHVNDPEEFWDPEKIPGWARERNWGYGPGDVRKEDLYAEVDRVLDDHPRLRIVFAHFYFLSADLPRARRFLDRHPSVSLDLAPGVEMLYHLSRDPESSRAFFTACADRLVFGTDLFSRLTVGEARARAGIVFRWLETDDTFRVPATADDLLGPPEDGVVRGMSLPEEVLEKIYRGNFTRLAGSAPRPLDPGKAIETCDRIAAIAEKITGNPAGETEAFRVARRLSGEETRP